MSDIASIGFIGLGYVGSKLAGTLVRNGYRVTVQDLNRGASDPLVELGAAWEDTPMGVAAASDMVISCLHSPAASAAVLEEDGGILAGMAPGKIWAEMSTTDQSEVRRLGALVRFRVIFPARRPPRL